MGDASVTVFKAELQTSLLFRLTLPIRLNRLGLGGKTSPCQVIYHRLWSPGNTGPPAQARLLFGAPCRVRGRRTSGVVYFGCHVMVIKKAKQQHVLALSQLWKPGKQMISELEGTSWGGSAAFPHAGCHGSLQDPAHPSHNLQGHEPHSNGIRTQIGRCWILGP